MKAIVVISLELAHPEQITDVLEAINPPGIPHFAGKVRIAIDPFATHVETWLDEDES